MSWVCLPNFSSLACLEVADSFGWWVGWGGFQVATMSNLNKVVLSSFELGRVELRWVSIFSWVSWSFKRDLTEGFWQEGGWVGSWNFDILQKHTILQQYQKTKKKIGNFLKKKDSKTLISMFDFVIWIDQTASQSLIFTSPSKIQILKQAYVIFEHSLSFLK